jgi:hypothetical protein
MESVCQVVTVVFFFGGYRTLTFFSEIHSRTDTLLHESKKYENFAKRMVWEQYLRTYGPFVGIAVLIVLFLFVRYYWW